jgi:hypothetical protein
MRFVARRVRAALFVAAALFAAGVGQAAHAGSAAEIDQRAGALQQLLASHDAARTLAKEARAILCSRTS